MKWYLFLIIIMMASCRVQRKIYSPLPVNNPSLQEKNDFSATASISDPKAFDLNGGFALTNRWAIIAGAYTHKNKDVQYNSGFTSQYDSSNLVYRHNGFTLGTGLFFPIGRPGTASYLSFYAGMNKGKFEMDEEFYQVNPNPSRSVNNYKSKLDRYFLQGSFNFYSKTVEASITTRYNLVEYKKVVTDYTNSQLEDFNLPPFAGKRLNSFFDISYDFRILFSRQHRWGIHLFSVITSRPDQDDIPNGSNGFYYYYWLRAGAGIFFRGLLATKKHE